MRVPRKARVFGAFFVRKNRSDRQGKRYKGSSILYVLCKCRGCNKMKHERELIIEPDIIVRSDELQASENGVFVRSTVQ